MTVGGSETVAYTQVNWGVVVNDSVTLASTTDHNLVIENGSKWRAFPQSLETIQTQKEKFDFQKFFNWDPGVLQTEFSANPQEQAYFIVWHQCQDGSAAGSMHYTVEIEYTVAMSEPKDFAQS